MTSILEMRAITKRFPGVNALENVNLTVEKGEIHALVGENGAGKSTLMKVLSGVYPSGEYEGEIVFEGEERHFHSIAESERCGIVIIHQELALVPLLSIAENIFLGNERAERGIIDWSETYRRTEELLKRVSLKESPRTKVTHLGLGMPQREEIAQALASLPVGHALLRILHEAGGLTHCCDPCLAVSVLVRRTFPFRRCEASVRLLHRAACARPARVCSRLA